MPVRATAAQDILGGALSGAAGEIADDQGSATDRIACTPWEAALAPNILEEILKGWVLGNLWCVRPGEEARHRR